jgi:hypothetical protein
VGLTAAPTVATTGVPVGTTLTAYTGPMTITSCGVTIDSKLITGQLVIKAGNGTQSASTPCVTIKNSLVKGTVYDGWTSQYHAGPLVMTDSEVANPTPADCATISDTNYYLTRVYAHGCRSGAQADGFWDIRDSYLLADVEFGSAHMDGFISNGNYGQKFVMDHNTLLCKPVNSVPNGAGCAADLGLFGDFSLISNGQITNNYIKATSDAFFCVHTGYEPGTPYPGGGNLNFTGNVWEWSGQKGQCGGAGSATFNWNNSAGTWCNNTWSIGGPVLTSADNCPGGTTTTTTSPVVTTTLPPTTTTKPAPTTTTTKPPVTTTTVPPTTTTVPPTTTTTVPPGQTVAQFCAAHPKACAAVG